MATALDDRPVHREGDVLLFCCILSVGSLCARLRKEKSVSLVLLTHPLIVII